MNNIVNTPMRSLLLKTVTANYKLNAALAQLLSEGFVCRNGCYFLNALHTQQRHIKSSHFTDRTGYECFINSIHIDDYVDEAILEQTLLFATHLMSAWNAQNNGLVIRIILGATETGFNLKFHLFRAKETWINESDIDKFTEALLVLNSSDS